MADTLKGRYARKAGASPPAPTSCLQEHPDKGQKQKVGSSHGSSVKLLRTGVCARLAPADGGVIPSSPLHDDQGRLLLLLGSTAGDDVRQHSRLPALAGLLQAGTRVVLGLAHGTKVQYSETAPHGITLVLTVWTTINRYTEIEADVRCWKP